MKAREIVITVTEQEAALIREALRAVQIPGEHAELMVATQRKVRDALTAQAEADET